MKKSGYLTNLLPVVFAYFFYCLMFPDHAGAFFLPDTGQTKCYNSKSTKQITCPAPGNSLAQDGSYTINPPSYAINPDGTVFDNNTWLTWQREDDNIIRNYPDAVSYCENLSLAGHTDWRLPTKLELATLVHYGGSIPAIDTTAFPNTKPDNYSTATIYPGIHDSAGNLYKQWYVHFGSGIEYCDAGGADLVCYSGGNNNYKDSTNSLNGNLYVRCVRGGPLSFGNFVDNSNGTITEKATGLTWQQQTGSQMAWGSALSYCEGITLGGYSDWRLPNIRELESLIVDTRCDGSCSGSINPVFFPGVQPLYWSSSTLTSNVSNRLTLDYSGFSSSRNKDDKTVSVLCVRGQQSSPLDKQEIQIEPQNIDFWYMQSGNSKSVPVKVWNVGTNDLTINTIAAPSAPFTLSSDGCSEKKLPYLATCSVTVEFNASAEGAFTSALTIFSNDADHPAITINLSGRVNSTGVAFFLPDTGQTGCYDGNGNVIACPPANQPFAQDGSYTMNPPSHTVNSNGTVTDKNTGLMWQREDDNITRTWTNATNYCESLTLGGYTDWRLPADKELFSLVHYGYWGSGSPSIDPTAFPTAKASYWSSTISASSMDVAWNINFGSFLSLYSGNKSTALYARCVRGEQLPSPVLQDNGDDTVTDLATGLMWQQGNGGYLTWNSALAYCEGLALGGYSDWRLPNVKELVSLTDRTWYMPAINVRFFPEVACDTGNYWTSTTYRSSASGLYLNAHVINLCTGGDSYVSKSSMSYPSPNVRCVRGGNTPPSLTLTGTVSDSYTGQLLANVAVSVTDSENSTYTAVTDSSGKYSITNLAPGGFTATFTKTGYVSYSSSGMIAADRITTFNVEITQIKPLSIAITSPQNGAVLNTSVVTVTGTINNTATVTVNGVPATVTGGTFTATISLADGLKEIKAIAQDVYNQTANASVIVTILTKGTVTGTVTDSATGLPLGSATVTVIDSLLTTLTALTDLNGTYTIANVTQGQFRAEITKDDYSTYTFTGTMTAGQTITVNGSITLKPPTLNTPAVVGITLNSVTITWTTDQASDSLVEYGTTTLYGNSVSDATLTKSHSITLNGLSQGTTYHFKTSSTNSHSLSSSSADGVFTTVTPPTISGVQITNMTTDSATITWTTDQPCSSRVEYGTTSSYGDSITNPTFATAHSIILTNLAERTTYHLRITSTNADGIAAQTADRIFATRAPDFSVLSLGDHGNVAVMEVVGDYNAVNPDGSINGLPRQEIAKEFLRYHEDNYDFLIVFSNFDFAMPSADAKAFYLGVRNDTQGIGAQLFDSSLFFGSAGKLQGMIDMGNVAALTTNIADPKFEETINRLAHEQLHRWGASVRFKNLDGTLNAGLLGKDGSHWSYLLDSDGSVLYGNDWQKNSDGTFTSTAASKYYSALDLYLMGMIDKTKVPPMTLIENPAIDPTKLPEIGVTITGTAKIVTIDDIVAAEGERLPNAASSQKTFKTGFIFITTPDTFTGSETAGIETLRSAWAGRFASLTGRRGSIADVTPAITVTITSPAADVTITRPDVTVKGAIINSTGNETGVTVNGIVAIVSGNQFIAEHVPLAEGANTITVTATDSTGSTATSAITVNATTTGNYITLTSNIESGIAPLEVTLRVDGSFSIMNSTLSASGPVQPEITAIGADEYKVKMIAEGNYTFTLSTTAPDNTTYQDTITITVLNRTQIDQLLKAKWEGMKTALLGGDIETALTYLIEVNQDRYRQAFAELGSNNISARFSDIVDLRLETLYGRVGQCWAIRVEAEGTFAYPVLFVKNGNGMWQIREF